MPRRDRLPPIPPEQLTLEQKLAVDELIAGKRGAVIPTTGKTRITIYVDDAVIKRFKTQSEKTGKGYQTLINEALNANLGLIEQPITQQLGRKIGRQQLSGRGDR